MLNLPLDPSYLSKVTTATGSVDDNAAPKVKAWYQVISSSVYPKIDLRTNANKKVPIMTPGIDKIKTFTSDFLNM